MLRLTPFLLVLHVLATVRAEGTEATIAMHITVSASQVPQLSRFLAAVYHTDNHYLIELAASLPVTPEISALARRNVVVRSAEPAVHDGVSDVVGTLGAMAHFLDCVRFDYFVSTCPEEYPVLSPRNMRVMLSWARRQRPSLNFLHFSHPSHWAAFANEYDRIHIDPALSFTRDAALLQRLVTSHQFHPDRARRVWTIPRTEKQLVVTREFAAFATDSVVSKKILLTLAEASHVPNHFFGALALVGNPSHGTFVQSSSLRCVNIVGLDADLKRGQQLRYEIHALSIDYLERAARPCLFAGPIIPHNEKSLQLRDDIDLEILAQQGVMGEKSASSFVRKMHSALMVHSSEEFQLDVNASAVRK